MPIEGCPDFATKEEVQELRDQLNKLLGETEDGGQTSLFEEGAGTVAIAGAAATTLLGMAKTNAPSVITDITLQASGAQSIWKELSSGSAKLMGFKGNGTQVPITGLNKVAKVAGQGNAGVGIAAQTASTTGAVIAVLANLVSIGASLALNIATVNVIDGRIEAEAKGARLQFDGIQASMLSLYEKNQGDIAAVQAEIADTNQKIEEQNAIITATQASVQQANDERLQLSNLIQDADTSIQELQARNQQLSTSLQEANLDIDTVNINLQTYINETDAKLTEAADIVARQQDTITKLEERILALETTITDLAWAYGRLDAKYAILRYEFDRLRLDIEGDPDLNAARVKLKSAQLILAESKVRSVNLGGSSGAAATGAANSQQGILELANNLAGNPITVPEITAAEVNARNSPFENLLTQLLPQINPNTMTPEQIESLQTGIKDDFKAELAAIGLVGLTDNLLDIKRQTDFDTLSDATQSGICKSVNKGGCSPTPNTPNPVQGLKGLKDLLSGKMDAMNASLNATAVAQNSAIMTVVQSTNDAVKHATFGLEAAHKFASTAWKVTRADKIMNGISMVLTAHNAMMLSNNLLSTLSEATNVSLEALGIRDETDKPLDFGGAVRGKIQEILTSILGAEQYAALTARTAKANRIYQASINVLDTTRNLFDSAHSIAEIGIEHTGQIGNALRDAGVVAEDAYGHMIEKVSPQNKALRQVAKFREGAELVEDALNTVSSVSSEVIEIQDNFEQLREDKRDLISEIDLTKEEKELEREEVKEESRVRTDISRDDFDALAADGQ